MAIAAARSRPCTLVMNGDKTVSATFAIADPCPPVCAPATATGTVRSRGEMSW
jgi:hypothetical protein